MILLSVGVIAALLVHRAPPFRADVLMWMALIALAELLAVPSWKGVTLSMDFPILLAVAFLHPAAVAGAALFVASWDPRELKHEVGVVRALFNRAQVASSALVGSAVFHASGSIRSGFLVLAGAALLGLFAAFFVNIGLVAVAESILHRLPIRRVLGLLRVGRPMEFLASYLAYGVLGVVLAELYVRAGFWAAAVSFAPLLLARQMFLRSNALEDALGALQVREQLLNALSTRMAEERQDERLQIAGYLHDDLAQVLFRLSLQLDIIKRRVRAGDEDAVLQGLADAKETKDRTTDMVRALIKDLHRSPLGRTGLAEALRSFTEDVGRGSGVGFLVNVADLPLAPPIQLLIYHIAREAVMNALKHSSATEIEIALESHGDLVEIRIRDDGVGFDAAVAAPEGHFGTAMMRERARVVGGTFEIESSPGQGATITVRLPASWIEEDQLSDPASVPTWDEEGSDEVPPEPSRAPAQPSARPVEAARRA